VKISSFIAPLIGAFLLATATNAAAPTAKPLPQIGPSTQAGFPSFDASSSPRSGFSTDARVALYFGGSIIRSVHVKSVSHPSTGVFCITPSVPIDFTHIFPIVTVDFTRSSGTGLLVFFRQFVSGQTECSSKEIEIVTVAFGSKSFAPSDHVAFILFLD
jgi:hypothetical protein